MVAFFFMHPVGFASACFYRHKSANTIQKYDSFSVDELFIYLLSFHCTIFEYMCVKFMYNEASLQQVYTQQGKLPK